MQRLGTFLSAIAALLLVAALPARAAPIAPEKAIERLFTEPLQSAWFAEVFMQAVPFPKISGIVTGLLTQYGAFQNVKATGDKFTVRLEKADVPMRIALDAEGRISGMAIEPPIPLAADVQGLVDTIAAFPGKTSILVTTDGATRGAHDADTVLAVGSAAKLAIMEALKQAIAAGTLSLDKIVPLDPAWRSLPTGILQDWPEGTPLTIGTLAGLMISLSDNTATDAMIDTVGRAAIEAITPRNTPFLKTTELFKLMAPANAALAKTWQDGSEAEKRALLDTLKSVPLPKPGELGVVPKVEWYMSATELCGLLDQVADMPALHINPGLADRTEWKDVAFKGGADNGVVSLATRVVGNDGKTSCVAAIWNDEQPVSTDKLATPYRGLLHALLPAQ